MLAGRGRAVRGPGPVTAPGHAGFRVKSPLPPAPANHRAPLARPEPDYEVVEFPSDQYVNAKLNPPPPPPRPQTGHPVEAGASCGLCGGGGARVRCTECGRRALCASCDDMYHRHPKRRHHQRQALSPTQLVSRDERPPLPPKAAPPVPPPRRHKISGDRSSASPRPPGLDQRRATLSSHSQHTSAFVQNNRAMPPRAPQAMSPNPQHVNLVHPTQPAHLGSMPYLPTAAQHASPTPIQQYPGQPNTLDHSSNWNRQRTSLPGPNLPSNAAWDQEAWDNAAVGGPPSVQGWGRPMRRGASTLALGGVGVGPVAACAGCAHCAPSPWRYGSCASLDHPWLGGWQQPCCPTPHPHAMRVHPHAHPHMPQTPQPYRRVDSRAVSRAASRTGSRAASPAMSVRSRASRRSKYRTPSPPSLPSSDADSESESEPEKPPPKKAIEKVQLKVEEKGDDSLGPPPPPPNTSWQCEFCTFVNEAGVRVCAVCCRTPTAVPKVVDTVPQVTESVARLKVASRASPAPNKKEIVAKLNGTKAKARSDKERTSTGCGPSPPRELQDTRRKGLATPTRDQSSSERNEQIPVIRHEVSVGPSPPRSTRQSTGVGPSPPRETVKKTPQRESIQKHSISVGPSPPREVRSSPNNTSGNFPKKFTGTSPPQESNENRASSVSSRRNVSNTGTSPPPQSISTQTYEDPGTYERAASVTRSRSRRRFRDEPGRERSHSRHSLSSDTRESERSARTSGGGRWEWRERDSSPGGGEWSETERRRGPRLTRRASHLDLHRTRQPARRTSSFYGSEAPSPEPLAANRTMSLEQLVGAGSRREAERGLELARLLSEAERLGFSAAEVHAALAQNPVAPLGWLRERWPSLCAGVRAAAVRLAPGAHVTEMEARAALARHRGAMWPAVTDCVERHRKQADVVSVGSDGRLRGRVWGSPVGADDDAAPPQARIKHRTRAEDSSDEYEELAPAKAQDDWMYLPLERNTLYPEEVEIVNLSSVPWDELQIHSDEFDPMTNIAFIDENHREVKSNIDNTDKIAHEADIAFTDEINREVKSNIDNVDKIALEGEAHNLFTNKIPHESDVITENHESIGSAPNVVEDKKIANEPQINIAQDKDIAPETKINTEDIAQKLKQLLIQAGIPSVDENLLLKGLLNQDNKITNVTPDLNSTENAVSEPVASVINKSNLPDQNKTHLLDLGQSENDFIDAYNALTRSSPLPNLMSNNTTVQEGNNVEVSKSDNNQPILQSFIHDTGPVEIVQSSRNSQIKNRMKQQKTLSKIIKPVPIGIIQTESSEDENFTKSPNKILASSSKRKSNVVASSISVLKPDDQTQEEDKTNNLREIVDSTQKMIQQMKDEINSDIHSLDDRNTTESETENSSNDEDLSSEHESSYSDTEGRTDEVSSDEDETSEAEEVEEEEILEGVEEVEKTLAHKTAIQILRTSSEENEQFEEALDHIEGQIEDFKRSNFDVLNTIARSLQEDQIISVARNSLEKQVTSPVNQINKKKEKINQDLNNNFTTAQSFDEIYAELNSTSVNNDKNMNNIPPKLLVTNNKSNALIAIIPPQTEIADVETNIVELINPLPKLETIIVIHQPESPLTMQITEAKPIVLNAIISNMTKDEVVLHESTSIEHNDNIESIDLHIEPNETVSSNSDSESDKVRRTPELEPNSISDSELPELQNVSEESISVPQQNTAESGVPSNRDTPESDNNQMVTQKSDSSTVNDFTHEMISPKSAQDNNENQNIDVIAPNEKTAGTHTKNNNSIPKTNSNTTKSNIPKPVKTLQNMKQKIEKPATKIIASKVPIRRSSGKQYPAPAPPKAHFGNVQNGHVKQLQTRLFNSKTPKISISANAATLVNLEPKPSTSTMSTKKPAPAPPKSEPEKQTSSPTRTSPEEQKKPYFRETCRTEDEWTESESEDSQGRTPIVKTEDEPERVFEPPPPITVRRVSGQMIDLAAVRLPEGSPERQARMLLAEGATETWEQARLAVELVSRGADPPAALLAALECADLTSALAYLYQDCELCASRLPEHEMVSMLKCTHRCCRECARLYFTVQVSERSIADCVCPYCKEPELEILPEDEWLEYFAHLDILLKSLLDVDVHELFQRKLRDRTLARDPNFRWCVECSSGFFVHPKQKKLRCPECRSVSCATCRKPWSANHEGLTCEQYATWLEDNDPERSVAAVQQHLRENGLECPRCHFKYSLSRGGCMHFTCTQCKYEFCYGCGKPFMMGARCGLSEYCAKLGLHAHHPRNCLFYLRDKEPHELQTLLQMNNVEFEVEAAEGSTGRCPIQLQKETPAGLVDAACGTEVPPRHAGLCKNHYLEYLSRLVRARRVDPLPLLGVDDLETLVRRASLRPPPRPYGTLEGLYKRGLAEIVKEKIPLD